MSSAQQPQTTAHVDVSLPLRRIKGDPPYHFREQKSAATTTPGGRSSLPATAAAIARSGAVGLVLVGAGEITNGVLVLVDGRISEPSLLTAFLAFRFIDAVQFRAVEVRAAPGALRALPIFNRGTKGNHDEGF